jgi:tyrosinase
VTPSADFTPLDSLSAAVPSTSASFSATYQRTTTSLSTSATPQVGCVYNFSSPSNATGSDERGCENCQRQEQKHTLMTGQVIITDPLVDHIVQQQNNRGMQLRSLGREDVVAYLKQNLHWRITELNDRVIPKENIPSVKVSVAMGKATHYAEHSLLSEYGDYEVLYEVTQGRLTGANPGDHI